MLEIPLNMNRPKEINFNSRRFRQELKTTSILQTKPFKNEGTQKIIFKRDTPYLAERLALEP